MIKLESVEKHQIVFSSPGCEDFIYLTPEKAFESMREIQNGLFAWHAMTQRRLYEMGGEQK